MTVEWPPSDLLKSYLDLLDVPPELADIISSGTLSLRLKESNLEWQDFAAASCYVLVVSVDRPDLVVPLVEPLKTALGALQGQASASMGVDLRRSLFHAHLALGLACLVVGQSADAKALLAQVTSTYIDLYASASTKSQLSFAESRDVAMGQLLATQFAARLFVSLGEFRTSIEVLRPVLYLTELFDMKSHVSQASQIFDAWKNSIPNQEDDLDQFIEWLDLLQAFYVFMSFVPYDDLEHATPAECEPHTVQFLTYQFGAFVAEFNESQASEWRFRIDYEEPELIWAADYTIQSLTSIHSSVANWEEFKRTCLVTWLRCARTNGFSPGDGQDYFENLGPASDLFWSMRSGLADRALSQVAPASFDDSQTDILQTIALRLLKMETVRPRTPAEVRLDLVKRFEEFQTPVSSSVVALLIRGEKRLEAYDHDDASISYSKAVEAALEERWTRPLMSFTRKGSQKINIPRPGRAPAVSKMSAAEIGRLSLRDWSDIFDLLADNHLKGLATLRRQCFCSSVPLSSSMARHT